MAHVEVMLVLQADVCGGHLSHQLGCHCHVSPRDPPVEGSQVGPSTVSPRISACHLLARDLPSAAHRIGSSAKVCAFVCAT
jgi:hypothetical protein